MDKITKLREKINKLPRVKLGFFPTPMEYFDKFSKEQGINFYMKREDVGTLNFHGNYARITEFTIGDAIDKKADIVIHGAVPQSNHCRTIASAAAKYNLECHLALRRDSKAISTLGNLYLDNLVGAHIHFYDVEVGEELNKKKKELEAELKKKYPDKNVYLYQSPTQGALGTIAMLECALETIEQMNKEGKKIDKIFLSSVGSNYAGFLMARNYLGLDFDIISVPPIDWDMNKIVTESINEANRLLGTSIDFSTDQIISLIEYLGEGYGKVTEECKKAIKYFAKSQGIVLEPVYTGKLMAALLDYITDGKIAKDENVIFLHSGGTPMVFAFAEDVFGE
ncbi:MAG: pyridoxal-phosphate dependent enzyme [Sphaerochaetaceae bacterium]|nr:pyridoxal-phosphate dependent enzyme [Sphaerochaetaceae bacterium]